MKAEQILEYRRRAIGVIIGLVVASVFVPCLVAGDQDNFTSPLLRENQLMYEL